MFRRTYAEINLAALKNNFLFCQKLSPQFICPMVKANAYGHGDVEVARALVESGAARLGVCLIEEALLLRQFGVKCDILVFRGFDREGAAVLVEHGLTPVVSSWEQLEALAFVHSRQPFDEPVRIHLKFDTGMNRLGFEAQEAEKLSKEMLKFPFLKIEGILTHLLCGEDAFSTQGRTQQQLSIFNQLISFFQLEHDFYIHALNSAGMLSQLNEQTKIKGHALQLRSWGARPGLAIYGILPSDAFESTSLLEPVMTLKSHISGLRRLQQGQTVSYNATWTSSTESVIAVVPLGYADGYHRQLSNQFVAAVEGERVPIVGQVCMDYLMLDVTKVLQKRPHLQLENKDVIFWGNEIKVTEVAQAAQTISWEILTSVSERVPRVYLQGPSV